MSSFTGRPHQKDEFGVEHTFQEGMNADYAPEATPATGYVSAGNCHLLRYLGSEVILSTDKGTTRRAQLPNDHFILGWATREGILYLVLGEVINGVATGGGQIGTYPAPDYTYVDPDDEQSELQPEGKMLAAYRPLHVYLGDSEPYLQRPSPFRSTLFNFSLNRPLEVIAQPSYDGSVNLLIHDRGTQPPLLINSGFRVYGEQQYQLLTRIGQVSTNRYTGADFLGRLQQQLRPQTAAKLQLFDVSDGGKLLGGEYRYYLLYTDADGNQTGVACELGPVSVFNGSSPGLAEGLLPGAPSAKRVRLLASGLDPALGYVRLAYVRRAGEPVATAGSASRTSERFAVPASGELEILHTGLETEIALPLEELLPLQGRLHRYTTAAATEQGRLLAANITTGAGTDTVRSALRAYARTCNLGHSVAELREPGLARSTPLDVSIPELYDTFGSRTVELDGYEGGYANPLNLCYRAGHHDAESYCWALQGQLLDGSETDAYPVRGLDNLLGNAAYQPDTAAGYYDEQGWNADRTQNVAGVYRFPRRGLGGIPAAVGTNGIINVLRAELQFPAIPQALAKGLRCLRIVRAPRRANRQFQGYLIPTLRAMAANPDNEEYDHVIDHMNEILAGTTVSNLKVLPAPQLTLEASVHDFDNDKEERVPGVYPFRFWATSTANNKSRTTYDPLRWALYSPDIYLRIGELRQQLSGTSWSVLPVGMATCYRESKYLNVARDQLSGGSWTCYKTAGHTLIGNQRAQSARFYVVGDNQTNVNSGRFGSHEEQLRGKDGSNAEFYVLRTAWEEYIGVELTESLLAASSLQLTSSGPNTGKDLSYQHLEEMRAQASPLAIIVDIYGAEGVWDGNTVRQAYPADTTSYAPVTDWLTPTELESQLVAGRLLRVYGGDALLGLSFRRVNRALPIEQTPLGEDPQPISQALGILTSSTVNAWTRSREDIGAVGNNSSSFPPRIGAEQGLFAAMRTYPYNTLKESLRYNAGYVPSTSTTPPAIISVRDNTGLVPFARTLFPQRVWSTPIATESALSNGWRYFPALLFRDYDIGAGAIVRVVSGPGAEVLLVYEYGLGRIQLNERGALGQQAGQPIYTQSLGLLPERAQVVATDLGCQHAFALDVSDVAVYGLDALHNVLWRYAWGSGKAVRLSDQRVSTLLKPATLALQGKPVQLLTRDARVTFDPFRGDVLVSIYNNNPLSE